MVLILVETHFSHAGPDGIVADGLGQSSMYVCFLLEVCVPRHVCSHESWRRTRPLEGTLVTGDLARLRL